MIPNHKTSFSEIIAGFSKTIWRGQSVYFKHFNNVDMGFFVQDEERIYENAHAQGLFTEQEKLESLKKDDIWTEAQERELRQEKEFLELQISTKKNLLIDSQIKSVNKQIEDSQKKINDILSARTQLVGFTVEHLTARKMNEIHMLRATYRDSDLSVLFFTEEQFNELEDSELEELILLYNGKLDFLNQTIKKLAVSNFFQNMFNLAPECIYDFYGKPVINLTVLQQDLYIYGRFFSNLLQGENKPSQEMLDNPDKLIEDYQKNQNLKETLGEKKADLSAGTALGATKEEYEKAGVKGRFINFREKLKPGQTELSSTDLANLFNQG